MEAINVTSERMLRFSLGTEMYAIPLLMVKEVIALPETTPIPHAPPYFLGIINLRGQVISVIDLRVKIGMKKGDRTGETAVIIVDLQDCFIGVVVDSVNAVFAPAANELSPPPDLEFRGASDAITGVVRQGSGLTLVLDISHVLDARDHTVARGKSEAAKTA